MKTTSLKTTSLSSWPRHRALALVAIIVVPLVTSRSAQAVEIIPSVGITKPATSSNERAQVSGGLALRGSFLPLLKSEVGIAYRREALNDNLHVRMWPVTASLWLQPIPALYAGGGVGWYHTTLDYAEALPLQDETRQEFGMHVGGGLRVPIASALALDLSGRYVFMDSQQSQLPPTTWDPDFWTTTLGLAIHF